MSQQTHQGAYFVVKAKLGDELRRMDFPLGVSFGELATQIKKLFGLASDPILKYQDEDNDWISLSSDEELKCAVKSQAMLSGGDGDNRPIVLKIALFSSAPSMMMDICPPTTAVPLVSQVTPMMMSSAPPSAPLYPMAVVATSAPSAPAAPTQFPWSSSSSSSSSFVDHPKRDKALAKEEWRRRKEEWKMEKELFKAKQKEFIEQNKSLKTKWNKHWDKHANKHLQHHGGHGHHFHDDNANDTVEVGGGKLVARFVKDKNTIDGTRILPGSPFVKTWRFRNEGQLPWPEGCRLTFISTQGDRMGAPDYVDVKSIVPGEEIDVSVNLVAPTKPGRYVGYWRMADANGKKYGQRVRCLVDVLGESSGSSSSDNDGSPVNPSFGQLLAQLDNLGFTDKKTNIRLLKKFGGDVDKVVLKLLKKQQKTEKHKKN